MQNDAPHHQITPHMYYFLSQSKKSSLMWVVSVPSIETFLPFEEFMYDKYINGANITIPAIILIISIFYPTYFSESGSFLRFYLNEFVKSVKPVKPNQSTFKLIKF